jgi:hypothetical protein
LIGWTSLSAAAAQERSVNLQLARLAPQDRALRVVYYTVARSRDIHARQVAAAARSFAGLTEGVYQVTVLHPVAPVDATGTSFVVPSDPKADAAVLEGRLPRGGCGPTKCEALALSRGLLPGQVIRVGPVRVEIVGVGSMRPAALSAGDELGSRQLLVRSITDRPLLSLVRDLAGMTSVTTAPLDPDRVHASALAGVAARLRRTAVSLSRSDPQNLVTATAPDALLNTIGHRGVVARERLLLISGQTAALVIAFAAFVASTRRRELRLLESQLIDLGASRFQAWSAGAFEVLFPGLAALVVALGGLAAAAALRAPSDESRASFIGTALPLTTLMTMVAVIAVAVALLAVAGSRRPGRRYGFGPLEAAAVVAFGIVVWQAVSTGELNANRLAASGHSPVLLLPALTFFVSAVALLRLFPLLVYLAERAARRAPTGVRLAFITAARRPAQAALTATFLAVAVGTATFSLDYRSTLERQARDQANFAAGARWRVVESSSQPQEVVAPNGVAVQPVSSATDVVPLTRFAAVSRERPTPVLRLNVQQTNVSAGSNQAGVQTTLLGIPADRLGDVRGWRKSFSNVSLAELAQRMRSRSVELGGPRIGDQTTELRLWVRTVAPYPTAVTLWFLLPGQDTRVVQIGDVSPSRWTLVSYRLPRQLRGTELIGIDLNPITQQFGVRGFQGTVWLGRIEQKQGREWRPTNSLTGWTNVGDTFARNGRIKVVPVHGGPVRSAIRYDRNGTSVPLLRRGAHLPNPIPALVSPSVAASAVDARATIVYAGSLPLAIKVVAVARYFPTITDGSRFIVLDYETAYAALNDVFPGSAPPSEAWFFDPQSPTFAARVSRPPFRVKSLVGESEREATLLSDPLASGSRSLLLVSAAIAAVLGLLGLGIAIVASLRDEAPMLAEYEALGIGPSLLARSAATRLAALSLIGVAVGLVGGYFAVRLVAALVAVTGGGLLPVPPIEAVVPWGAAGTLIGGVGFVAVGCALVLARRAFRRPVAERLRA